jgi:hypothetical protein
MLFEAPIDNAGYHTITAWSYGATSGSFTCQAQSIQGGGGNWGYWGAWDTFNPNGQEGRSFTVYSIYTFTLRLLCTNVPNGRGVASVEYAP